METVIRNNLPQNEGEITSALTYIEDPGQRPLICLFTAGKHCSDVETVNGFLRNAGMSNLTRVRKVMHIDEMPLLGTGKTNYRELTDLLKNSWGLHLNAS
jgi:non-ribosomal peptide synthetase component E (peptide arylation enzyme)